MRLHHLMQKFEGRCVYCDKKLNDDTATTDHLIPKSCQGGEKDSNYVLACKACNGSKGDADPRRILKLFLKNCPNRLKLFLTEVMYLPKVSNQVEHDQSDLMAEYAKKIQQELGVTSDLRKEKITPLLKAMCRELNIMKAKV